MTDHTDGFFEGKDEKTAHADLLALVAEYCDRYHNTGKDTPYREGDRIPYASRVYDHDEMVNLTDAALEFWLTSGRFTREFEREFARYEDVRFANLVNSGSSANLLAFMTLTSPLLKERQIRRGDEVITVSAGFPTTITPILNYGAVPVFVDVTIPQYNIDVTRLENALSDRTKAVMIAHTLGNPFDLQAVTAFCKKHGLWLIEDNCDALGSRYELDGEWKLTGAVGDLGTSSFYPPHHMTMGEGGAVYTNDPLLQKIARSIRDWGRDCVCESGQDNRCGHRFSGQYGELPQGYDHKYVYSHFGYNLQATDLQASIGCAQLKKFPSFVKRRRENWAFLSEALSDTKERIILPEACPHSEPSWFGFCMTLRDGLSRENVIRYIEDHGVQTRLLFAGNMVKQPCFDSVRGDERVYRVAGSLAETDRIMTNTFWIGVYPGMTEDRLSYMAKVVREAVMRQ